MTIRTHILALCCLFILGCGAKQRAETPSQEPRILLWSPDSLTTEQAEAWVKEIQKVEKEPFTLLVAHGESRDGIWWSAVDSPRVSMEMRNQVAAIHNHDPGRIIWVVSCNPGAHKLDVPGARVRYALNIVYALPNGATALWPWRRADWVGDPSRFVRSERRVRLAGER